MRLRLHFSGHLLSYFSLLLILSISYTCSICSTTFRLIHLRIPLSLVSFPTSSTSTSNIFPLSEFRSMSFGNFDFISRSLIYFFSLSLHLLSSPSLPNTVYPFPFCRLPFYVCKHVSPGHSFLSFCLLILLLLSSIYSIPFSSTLPHSSLSLLQSSHFLSFYLRILLFLSSTYSTPFSSSFPPSSPTSRVGSCASPASSRASGVHSSRQQPSERWVISLPI